MCSLMSGWNVCVVQRREAGDRSEIKWQCWMYTGDVFLLPWRQGLASFQKLFSRPSCSLCPRNEKRVNQALLNATSTGFSNFPFLFLFLSHYLSGSLSLTRTLSLSRTHTHAKSPQSLNPPLFVTWCMSCSGALGSLVSAHRSDPPHLQGGAGWLPHLIFSEKKTTFLKMYHLILAETSCSLVLQFLCPDRLTA